MILVDRLAPTAPLGRLVVRKSDYSGELEIELLPIEAGHLSTTLAPLARINPNAAPHEYTHAIGGEGGRVELQAIEVASIVNAEPAGLLLDVSFLGPKGDGVRLEASGLREIALVVGLGWPVFVLGLRGSLVLSSGEDEEERPLFRLGPYEEESADRETYVRLVAASALTKEDAIVMCACAARLRAAGYPVAPISR